MSTAHVHIAILSEGVEATQPIGTATVEDSLDTLAQLYEYNHWIYSVLRPHIQGRVLEIGCGTGNITQFLAMQATHVLGVDPVAPFIERFQQCFEGKSHVSAFEGYLDDLPIPTNDKDRFDTAVSCNVLEHIEDDVAALKRIAQHVRPSGKVLIFVPAGPMALGRLDRELGHFRRYTRRSLRTAMDQAGLVWTKGVYFNRLGLFGWWLNSVVFGRRSVPVTQARMMDRLTPFLSAMERLAPLPWGQSVLGVAVKPEA